MALESRVVGTDRRFASASCGYGPRSLLPSILKIESRTRDYFLAQSK
jgi:hypothetical protein